MVEHKKINSAERERLYLLQQYLDKSVESAGNRDRGHGVHVRVNSGNDWRLYVCPNRHSTDSEVTEAISQLERLGTRFKKANPYSGTEIEGVLEVDTAVKRKLLKQARQEFPALAR